MVLTKVLGKDKNYVGRLRWIRILGKSFNILLDVLPHSKNVDLDAPAVNVSSAHGPVGHPWSECDYVTNALQFFLRMVNIKKLL